MKKADFIPAGRKSAIITEIVEKIDGVNETTGEAWTYYTVYANAGEAKPYKENIFIDKYFPMDKLYVGAPIDIVYSTNKANGVTKSHVFPGNPFATLTEKLQAIGVSEDGIKKSVSSAADAIRARMAARAAARG